MKIPSPTHAGMVRTDATSGRVSKEKIGSQGRLSHTEGAEEIAVDPTRHWEAVIVLVIADGITSTGPNVAIDRTAIVTLVSQRNLHVYFDRTIISIVTVIGWGALEAYAWIHSNRCGLEHREPSAAYVTIAATVVIVAPVPLGIAALITALVSIVPMLLSLFPMVLIVIAITEQKSVQSFVGEFGSGGNRRHNA